MSTDLILSADSHVVEPWWLWQQRVPAEFKDRAPHVIDEGDNDRLVCEDLVMPQIGLMAGVFRSDSEVRTEGKWDRDIPEAAYDPNARLAELEADGIAGEVLFPTLGLFLYAIQDLDLKWALFRAYNDWLADFCAAHPDRYKGIAMVDPADISQALAEVERAAQNGLAGVMVPTFVGDGQPPYQDRAYDPLWEVSVKNGMAVHIHSGTSAASKRAQAKSWKPQAGSGRDPLNSVMKGDDIARVLLAVIFGGTFDRFPELVFVSAENESGWAPHLLDRADYEFKRYQHLPRLGYPEPCINPPSNYWRTNIKTTFMRDPVAVRTHDMAGTESLMFQTDFPHGVSTYPNSRKIAEELFDGIDPQAREKILYGNAAALYGFDLD